MRGSIDVIAALDAISQASVGPLERQSIAGIRAAVAELIEAAQEMHDADISSDLTDDITARVGAALKRVRGVAP